MDKPTPAGFVADAVEQLGKLRAQYEDHRDLAKEYKVRAERYRLFVKRLTKWAEDGGPDARRPKPPRETP